MNTSVNSPATMTVRLGNADFSVTRQLKDVASLQLDPRNPRLGYLLSTRKTGSPATDAELHEMLWDQDPVKSLAESIRQNGGLIQDPVVRADGVVVEGNCRTVALRELAKKYPKDDRFRRVWVQVLPTDVTEEQISLLLGELHIAGKIEWKAYDQAEYVWRMHKLHHRSYDFLATLLRWSRTKLSQRISAYEETKRYLESRADPVGIHRFSYFEEFMRQQPLRKRRDDDRDFMELFGAWVFEDRFIDARDVRDLPQILANPDALEAFVTAKGKGTAIRAARKVLHNANPALSSNLYATLDKAITELETISLQELTALEEGDEKRLDYFNRLEKALQLIRKKTATGH